MLNSPNASEPFYGVTCKHGQAECAGNVQELCAAKYHSTSEWWSFVQCQNFQGRDNIGTPETALNCANAAGINWENGKAGQCAGRDGRGTEGIQLLQQSTRDSIAAGIQYVLRKFEDLMGAKPAIGKAARSSSMANKYVYGMALGMTARYAVKQHCRIIYKTLQRVLRAVIHRQISSDKSTQSMTDSTARTKESRHVNLMVRVGERT